MPVHHENQHKYWTGMQCSYQMQFQIGQPHTIGTQHYRCWQMNRVCSRCKCRVNHRCLGTFPQHNQCTAILLFPVCILCTVNCLGSNRYRCHTQCKRTNPPQLILYLLCSPYTHCCCLTLACCFAFQLHIRCSLLFLQHPSPSNMYLLGILCRHRLLSIELRCCTDLSHTVCNLLDSCCFGTYQPSTVYNWCLQQSTKVLPNIPCMKNHLLPRCAMSLLCHLNTRCIWYYSQAQYDRSNKQNIQTTLQQLLSY